MNTIIHEAGCIFHALTSLNSCSSWSDDTKARYCSEDL